MSGAKKNIVGKKTSQTTQPSHQNHHKLFFLVRTVGFFRVLAFRFRMSHITQPKGPRTRQGTPRDDVCSGAVATKNPVVRMTFLMDSAVFHHWNMVNLEDTILILGEYSIQYHSLFCKLCFELFKRFGVFFEIQCVKSCHDFKKVLSAAWHTFHSVKDFRTSASSAEACFFKRVEPIIVPRKLHDVP